MDYILQLRQYIGHRPILMVGAAILVISPNSDNHTNRYHPFLALDVEKRGGLSEEDIDRIEVHPTPLTEIIRMAQRGELLQAMQVSALFFALSHLKRIAP